MTVRVPAASIRRYQSGGAMAAGSKRMIATRLPVGAITDRYGSSAACTARRISEPKISLSPVGIQRPDQDMRSSSSATGTGSSSTPARTSVVSSALIRRCRAGSSW